MLAGIHVPERVLQSLSLIPFDWSQEKKSLSDMVLLNFELPLSSSAGTFTPVWVTVSTHTGLVATSYKYYYFNLLDKFTLHASMASEALPQAMRALTITRYVALKANRSFHLLNIPTLFSSTVRLSPSTAAMSPSVSLRWNPISCQSTQCLARLSRTCWEHSWSRISSCWIPAWAATSWRVSSVAPVGVRIPQTQY